MTTDELEPCPFCGEQAEISKHFRDDVWRLIHRCKIVGPISMDWTESRSRLVRAWNTRTGSKP